MHVPKALVKFKIPIPLSWNADIFHNWATPFNLFLLDPPLSDTLISGGYIISKRGVRVHVRRGMGGWEGGGGGLFRRRYMSGRGGVIIFLRPSHRDNDMVNIA